jgi:hypothetical protein
MLATAVVFAINACTLISPGVIEKTLGEPLQNTKPTTQIVGEVLFSQCFYNLATFTKSISVAVTAPGPADVHHDAARHLWEHWFHHAAAEKDEDSAQGKRRNESEEEEARAKAEPVTGIGDEAFWVRSFVGNLYVRKGDQFVRISIGGKQTPEERLTTAKQLASDALKHMP